MFDISSRSVSEQKILSVEGRVFVSELPKFISNSFDAIYTHLRASGAQPSGVSFVIYHGKIDNDSDGPAEVCVPCTGSLEPTGRLRVRLEPAHEEAFTVMKKSALDGPELMHGYDAVANWLRERGKTCTLGSREVYFADWDKKAPDEPALDIAFPY